VISELVPVKIDYAELPTFVTADDDLAIAFYVPVSCFYCVSLCVNLYKFQKLIE